LFCKAESSQKGYENQSSAEPQGGARFTDAGWCHGSISLCVDSRSSAGASDSDLHVRE